MNEINVLEFAGRDTISDPLTALLRSGAQQLINQAVAAELQDLLPVFGSQCHPFATRPEASQVCRRATFSYGCD